VVGVGVGVVGGRTATAAPCGGGSVGAYVSSYGELHWTAATGKPPAEEECSSPPPPLPPPTPSATYCDNM
jgi:hypothetical protein